MAKTVIVKIPNVSEEVRIGYSFNYMIKVMAETETADVVQWDFADVTFLHPFFLAPLAIYKNTSGKNIECINMSLRIQSYLNCICFACFILVRKRERILRQLCKNTQIKLTCHFVAFL